MAKAGYFCRTGAAVGLSAGVAKSVLSVICPAQFGIDLKKVRVSFDGVTATAVPVVVEICVSTQATGGTFTTGAVTQIYGRSITPGFTSNFNYTVEPTVLTQVDDLPMLDPNKGLVMYDWPLGDTPDSAVSQAFIIRCTAPAAVNARASMQFERA
jgi:hypothetical protein